MDKQSEEMMQLSLRQSQGGDYYIICVLAMHALVV